MQEISLSSEEVSTLNHERFYHPHPQVRRRMTVVWMRAQGRRPLMATQIPPLVATSKSPTLSAVR